MKFLSKGKERLKFQRDRPLLQLKVLQTTCPVITVMPSSTRKTFGGIEGIVGQRSAQEEEYNSSLQ